MPPPLLLYATQAEYRRHYEDRYCRAVMDTFDGLRVLFPRRQFDHAFFKSAGRRTRDKSLFDWERAKRMDWIAAALQDPDAERYVGWDRDRKRLNPMRRITIVYGNYVVVLNVTKARMRATFITAYLAEAKTLGKIRAGPQWA